MSRSLSINIYLRPFSIAIYGKFDWYCLYLSRPFSGLQIVQIWSVNYALQFPSVKITNIVYIGVYLVLAYIERSF